MPNYNKPPRPLYYPNGAPVQYASINTPSLAFIEPSGGPVPFDGVFRVIPAEHLIGCRLRIAVIYGSETRECTCNERARVCRECDACTCIEQRTPIQDRRLDEVYPPPPPSYSALGPDVDAKISVLEKLVSEIKARRDRRIHYTFSAEIDPSIHKAMERVMLSDPPDPLTDPKKRAEYLGIDDSKPADTSEETKSTIDADEDPHRNPVTRARYYGAIPVSDDAPPIPSLFQCRTCEGAGGDHTTGKVCESCKGAGSVRGRFITKG